MPRNRDVGNMRYEEVFGGDGYAFCAAEGGNGASGRRTLRVQNFTSSLFTFTHSFYHRRNNPLSLGLRRASSPYRGANKKSVRAITYKKPPLSLRTTEALERGSTPVYISARKYAPGR